MARKSVIAYYMHENERAAAEALLGSENATDSFAVGEIDEADVEKLRAAGVIVQDALPPAEEAPPVWEEPRPAGAFSLQVAPGGAAAALDAAVPAEEDWYVIRLKGPLLEPRREELAKLGVELTRAHDHDAYQARLSSRQVADVSRLPFVAGVRWISPMLAAPRIATKAAAPGMPGGGLGMAPVEARPLPFDVRLHDSADRPKVQDWLAGRNVEVLGTGTRKIRISARPDAPVLGELALLPEVDRVVEYVEPKIFNDFARRLMGLDGPQPAAGPAPPLLPQDGSGQIVAVADTGLDDQHPDFAGRILGVVARGRPGDASDPHGHGTHVAGSVLGDGAASGGQLKGAAPKAQLFFQSLLDARGGLGGLPVDLNDLFQEAYDAGARIHNDSWGADLGSIYTLNSEEVDEFIHDHPDMLVVIAAGNAGKGASPKKAAPGFVDWLSIGSPASCKNALTVGASRSDRTDGPFSALAKTWGDLWGSDFPTAPIAAEKISGDPQCLAAFSSRGPTDDRRIKPDLVAPGTEIASARSSKAPAGNFWGPHPRFPQYAFDGGTSMATPLVAGCAALARQYYVDTGQVEPSAALLKATLINSTVWLTGADATAPTAGTPNYHQGHGRIDMRNAIPNPARPQLALQFVDTWKTPGQAFTRTGERRRYQFILPAGVSELRICLAYTDAPARGLQNNVDLMLNHLTSGRKWMGNEKLPDALTLPDPDNNVEVVRLANPDAGPYLIQVFVANMLKPPQDFALVVTGEGVPALIPI